MPLVRQAYRARTVHRPIVTSRQTSQDRINPADVAKKTDLHTIGVVPNKMTGPEGDHTLQVIGQFLKKSPDDLKKIFANQPPD